MCEKTSADSISFQKPVPMHVEDGPGPQKKNIILPEWILLLPAGQVELVDRPEPLQVDPESLATIVRAFRSRGVDLVIDYEHQSLQGRQAPAAGWIKDLEARADGLWARVEWTPQAQEYLRNREYRYFSPVLQLDPETRKPLALLQMGLTNVPTIKRLPALEEAAPVTAEAWDQLGSPSPPDHHQNAAGKKLCGMCAFKAVGEWRCTGSYNFSCPHPFLVCLGFSPKPRKTKPAQAKPERLPIPPGVTFSYYHRITRKVLGKVHQGMMSVATMIEPKLPGKILMGVAFNNSGSRKKKIPPDPFCKYEGRNQALKKLFDNPIVVPYLYEPRRIAKAVALSLANREFGRLRDYGVQMPPNIERMVPGWATGLTKNRTVRKRGIKFEQLPILMQIDLVSNFLGIRP